MLRAPLPELAYIAQAGVGGRIGPSLAGNRLR